KPAQANDREGKNDQASLRQYRHLSQTPHHQCSQRIDQLQGAVGQVHCSRLSQQGELHYRYLLPLWRARSISAHPLTSRNAQKLRSSMSTSRLPSKSPRIPTVTETGKIRCLP